MDVKWKPTVQMVGEQEALDKEGHYA